MELLNYKQTSQLLGMPLGTLYALVSKRRIPHIRLSNRLVRFDKTEIEAWLRQHPVGDRTEATPTDGGKEENRA